MDSKRYKLNEVKNGLEIYHIESGMLNQEKFIRIVSNNRGFIIYLISRDNIQEIGLFAKKELAIGVIVILCHKLFERLSENNSKIRELRVAANSYDMNKIDEIIESECRKQFYSVLSLKNNAICIVKNNNSYNVYYKNLNVDKEIVVDVGFSRAIIVTRNFARLLQNYDELYNWISKSLSFEEDYYITILEYYLF